jgi:hypothetical protein
MRRVIGRTGRVRGAVALAIACLAAVVAIPLGAIGSANTSSIPYRTHEATGVGSCTLIGWNPHTVVPEGVVNAPAGHRLMTYRPDNYDCIGARFAQPGVEFAKFPQPRDFKIVNRVIATSLLACRRRACRERSTIYWQPTRRLNVLLPYFPPFTHFVIIYRENHTFDDYLGDCGRTVIARCNGKVMTPNHIRQVPDLHKLARTYALDDSYSTGTQPPSGPNHWWLFSAQSASSWQEQPYPSAHGTQFDRFLGGDSIPPQGTSACRQTSRSGSGRSRYTFVMNGDFYWILNYGSGYFKNRKGGRPEVLPIDRPGTRIPEEINYDQYTCSGQSVSDPQVADGFLNFVKRHGLPAYSYVELFNDHPGTYQNVSLNDAETYQIVRSLMASRAYRNNTLIVVTEDDTQNGDNGPDHVSNTYRVPLVVIGSPKYVKPHHLSHVAYTTSNVIAAMERVMENVRPGIISRNGSLGRTTFPMTTSDQSALGDPLEAFWVRHGKRRSASASAARTARAAVSIGAHFQGALGAVASALPASGRMPLTVRFAGFAGGGAPPYRFRWSFGDGSRYSAARSSTHTYMMPGTYRATLTVRHHVRAQTVTASVVIRVAPAGGAVPGRPVDVTATAAGGSVILAWHAPASVRRSKITAYEVFRGTSPGAETYVTSGGCAGLAAKLTCTDTRLKNGTAYYYYVMAANAAGAGPQSKQISAAP